MNFFGAQLKEEEVVGTRGRERKREGGVEGRVRLKESLREYDSDFPAPCRIRNRQALEETLAARGHALIQEKKEEKKYNVIKQPP